MVVVASALHGQHGTRKGALIVALGVRVIIPFGIKIIENEGSFQSFGGTGMLLLRWKVLLDECHFWKVDSKDGSWLEVVNTHKADPTPRGRRRWGRTCCSSCRRDFFLFLKLLFSFFFHIHDIGRVPRWTRRVSQDGLSARTRRFVLVAKEQVLTVLLEHDILAIVAS